MKVAIFHELDFGGARRCVYELAIRLNKIFDLDLYYIDSKKDKKINGVFKNIFYYPFFAKDWKGKDWSTRLYKDTVELIKLYMLHKKIAKEIKSKKYDYILVNPSKFTQAPFLLRFLKNKCIYFCQEPLRIVYDPVVSANIKNISFPKSIYEFLNRKIRKWIDRRNFKSAPIILANSSYSKGFIEKSYGRKAQVCYLGVDIHLFKPLNIDRSIDILFIGNKDESYSLLSESLKFFKIRPKVKTIFRNYKTNISDKKLVEIYNRSKVLAALNQNEPFGLIPLEAMACQTPVVAINEGGYKESIVDNKTGFLVRRNARELAAKIERLLQEGNLFKTIGDRARKHIEKNWTWEISVKNLLKILR